MGDLLNFPKRYGISYRVQHRPVGVSLSDLPEGELACDVLVVLSSICGLDGSSTTSLKSLNGATGQPVTVEELFLMWVNFGANLAANLPRGTPGHLLATELVSRFKAVKQAMAAGGN